MDPVLLHLLFILSGVAVAIATLWWFAKVSGGWYSLAGFIAIMLLAVGVMLIFTGFGVSDFPGLTT